MRSLVVVRCCLIVCYDADEVKLFHGVIGDGCRELNRELYKL